VAIIFYYQFHLKGRLKVVVDMVFPVHLLSEMIKTTVRSSKAVVIAYLGSSREYLMFNKGQCILGVL
jgi:hypothetical protein